MLHVRRTQIAHHLDDPVLPQIRGIRHRGSPVTVHPTRIFPQQCGILQYQLTDGIGIAAPDGIGHSACRYKPCPVWQPIAFGEHKLRIREFGTASSESFRVML